MIDKEKQEKLLELYKKFFDKLDLELKIDTKIPISISLIGVNQCINSYGVNGERPDEEFLVSNFEETYFNSEDLIGLFKQIKELEDD